MRDNYIQINDEGLRLAANIESHYDTWIQARRALRASGRLTWKTSGGREYLYSLINRGGDGTSLGPRSDATEKQMEAYQTARATASRVWERLVVEGKLYRTLRLPRIASYAGDVLRRLDTSGLLGDSVLVVGTNALCAYALEAAHLLPSNVDATEDFDLTWSRKADSPAAPSETIFEVLKETDGTYTINTERTFQARNADGREVELLIAPSAVATLPRRERLSPIPLPEQEWLLLGRRVTHVVCGMDGLPARVVAPDPRWFALHKLWLAEKPARNVLKAPKDRLQGDLVLRLVAEHMPQFPLDAEFVASIPAELKPHWDRWDQGMRASDARHETMRM